MNLLAKIYLATSVAGSSMLDWSEPVVATAA
jgi:hypothetical protein